MQSIFLPLILNLRIAAIFAWHWSMRIEKYVHMLAFSWKNKNSRFFLLLRSSMRKWELLVIFISVTWHHNCNSPTHNWECYFSLLHWTYNNMIIALACVWLLDIVTEWMGTFLERNKFDCFILFSIRYQRMGMWVVKVKKSMEMQPPHRDTQ